MSNAQIPRQKTDFQLALARSLAMSANYRAEEKLPQVDEVKDAILASKSCIVQDQLEWAVNQSNAEKRAADQLLIATALSESEKRLADEPLNAAIRESIEMHSGGKDRAYIESTQLAALRLEKARAALVIAEADYAFDMSLAEAELKYRNSVKNAKFVINSRSQSFEN